METGKVVKIHKDVPDTIPIEIPMKRTTEDTKEIGMPPVTLPIRKDEEVPA